MAAAHPVLAGWALRAGRRGVAVAFGAAVLAATFGALSGTAWADASQSTVHQQPADGSSSQSTYQTNLTLSLTGTVVRQGCGLACNDSGAPVSLQLADPTGCTRTLATTTSSSQTQLSYSLNLGSESLPAGSSCAATSGAPAPNGTWVLSLTGDNASAATSFTTEVPPAAPANVSAAPASDTSAGVSWSANTEPDLTSYSILDSNGDELVTDINPSSACSGGSCAATVSFPPDQAAGTHSLEVEAQRSAGPGTNSTLSSSPSAPAQVTLAGPPRPTPSPTPSTAPTAAGPSGGATGSSSSPAPGSGGASSGGTSAGSAASPGAKPSGSGATHPDSSRGAQQSHAAAVAAQQQAVALSFSAFAPAAGVAQLPPLPVLPVLPGSPGTVEPTNPGTYSPTLNYPNRYVVQKVVKQTGALQFYNDITSTIPPRQLWSSVAAGLLMLLAAGHLRLWLRRQAARR
ncbi:MAG: hypothetical protein ACYDAQ_11905 [Mycobacteriales bacterium]